MVIAIEPFATTGKGMVEEGGRANIFSVASDKPVRSPFARQILQTVQKVEGLPFTTRWLTERMTLAKVNLGLRELRQRGVIKSYPPLVEVNKGIVSQAEHTFLVDDKVEVLTKV